VNRRLSALILGAAGAAAVIALPAGRESEAAADPVAVETYLAQLSETTPRVPAAPPAGNAEDPENAKKADRAERILNGVYSVAR